MCECRVEIRDTNGEVDVARIHRLARAHGAAVASDEVQLSVAEREPGAAEVEGGGAFDLFELQDVTVESLRAIEIRDG